MIPKKFFKILFQVSTSTIGLLFVLEMICRLAGQAPGAGRFVERIVVREGLTPKKPKGEFRIFAFGESTMHGAHYAPVSSPARWLEKYLHDFLPDRKIRVINFARLGRGAFFAARTLRETLVYKPDLIIVYLGHNSFLPENRKDHIEARARKWNSIFREACKKSSFSSTVYRWFVRLQIRRHQDRPEDRIESYVIESPPLGYGTENVTPRNTPFYRENIEFFKHNLLNLLRAARKNRIPILFLKPASNLKDFAPYYSLHMRDLNPRELARWEKFYERGREKEKQGNLKGAFGDYLRAYKLDPTYAELSFRLGQIDYGKGNFEKAKKFFEEARDNDAIIFRATNEILQVYDDLKRTENIELVETEKILLPEVPHGILGEPVIEDNCHFSLKGHARVGHQVAEEIAKRNWLAPQAEWQFRRERPYEEMAKELGIDPELLFSADLKMVHYFGSRFPNRLRYARKALEIHPEDPRALRHLAWSYWLAGEKEKAFRVYREIKQVDPKIVDEIFAGHKDLESSFEDYEASGSGLFDRVGNLNKNGFSNRPK